MDKIETAIKVLEALHEEKEKHGYMGRLQIDDLVEKLRVDREAIERVVHYLHEREFVRCKSNAVVDITTKGEDVVDGPSLFNPPGRQHQMKTEIYGGTIGQVVQAHKVTFTASSLLDHLTDEIRRQSDLDEDQKKSWLDHLSSMSSHPAFLKILDKALWILGNR